jgi:hypothetical protein
MMKIYGDGGEDNMVRTAFKEKIKKEDEGDKRRRGKRGENYKVVPPFEVKIMKLPLHPCKNYKFTFVVGIFVKIIAFVYHLCKLKMQLSRNYLRLNFKKWKILILAH